MGDPFSPTNLYDACCGTPPHAGPQSPPAENRKAGRRGAKPPLHWIPLWALQGTARVIDYGARKYAPGNWLLAANEADTGEALTDYLSAAQRHWAAIQAADPGGVANWGAVDSESGLPHLDHLIASLVMLRGIAQASDVLAADPGRGVEPTRIGGVL